jgi:flagellar biosynthesis protein FliQ
MYWPLGVQLIQSALVIAVWVALPLVVAIAAAGLAAGFLQTSLNQSDPVALYPPRLVGAVLALVFFGTWMLALVAHYWTQLWVQAGAMAQGLGH